MSWSGAAVGIVFLMCVTVIIIVWMVLCLEKPSDFELRCTIRREVVEYLKFKEANSSVEKIKPVRSEDLFRE